MHRKLGWLAALATSLAVFTPAPAVAAPLPATMSATVDVNVLFVGFKEKQYYGHEGEPHDFTAIYSDVLEPVFLPHVNDTIIRSEYTLPDYAPVPADASFDYTYNVGFASSGLERKFFDHLTRIGRSAARTKFQTKYNDQQSNAVEIPDRVLRIPGEAVEQWLLDHEGQVPGFRPGAPTLVFINWFGRPGFRFHYYQGDGTEPDTGASDLGALAWGASHGRLWFYDASAGPDITNWNIDDTVFFLPSNGLFDQRMVPTWEMKDDPRPFIGNDATSNVGLLGRYSLLTQATASPLYDPLTKAPRRGGSRVLRMNLFQGDPSVPRHSYLKKAYVDRELKALQPYLGFRSTLAERPLAGENRDAYDIWRLAWEGIEPGPGCWERFANPFAELYCQIIDHEADFAAPAGPRDRVIPGMLYNIDAATDLEHPYHPAGLADSDLDLKPSYIFYESSPFLRQFGWFGQSGVGMSAGVVHETGHIAGLPHQHDGWDPEGRFHFDASVARWLYTLDECHCPMGYLSTTSFGQFDQDTGDRTLAARYYAEAFRLLGSLGPRPGDHVRRDLGAALNAFAATRWRAAVLSARDAYERAVEAAPAAAARAARQRSAGVKVAPPPGAVDPLQPGDGDAKPFELPPRRERKLDAYLSSTERSPPSP